MYLLTLLVSAIVLLTIDRLPAITDPLVAFKRLVIVSFPASFAATVVDSLKEEPQATRRPRLGKSSEASGTRGGVRSWHAVERSRFLPQAKEGKRDSF